MKKYLLIDVFERDMGLPQVFDTMDAAVGAMVKVVAEVLRMEPEELMQKFREAEGNIVGEYYEVHKTCAYANISKGSLDVAIYELDTESWRCAV